MYLLLERGKGREKVKERNIDFVQEKHQLFASRTPPTWMACNPGMCPDHESNRRPFGLQASAQSTEPHYPGREFRFLKHCGKIHVA